MTTFFDWFRAFNRESDVSSSARSVGNAMATRADSDTLKFWVTIQEVSDFTGMSPRNVIRKIDELNSSGWVPRLSRGRMGKASEYVLKVPQRDSDVTLEGGPNVTPVSNQRDTSVTINVTPVSNQRDTSVTPTTPKLPLNYPITTPTPYRPPAGDSPPRGAAKTRNTYPDAFEEWWRTYPRRKNASKKAAHTQWAKAVKQIDAQRLLELTASYADNPGVSDPKYIPHPQKWLRDQRWESIDETNNHVEAERVADGTRPEDWLVGYTPPANEIEAEVISWQIEA